ncbi:tRNA pseudouridine(55) synthase TruB [Candidatus Saccharibacteria bacterium]|nr:tRNA pseudouridine(55) synthase TruB [Candidatus Saccharibacteria bacterium]
MDGILLIDKPEGWTSFDVVAKVRGLLRQAASEKLKVESEKYEAPFNFKNLQLSTRAPKVRVGHTGTLDPLATGLLVIVVGSYCKRAQEFSKLDKVYEVTMKLGQTSTTGDEEGVKTITSNQEPETREIEAALEKFSGEIMQTPPIYSAIKVNGQRAYKLAREGKEVKLEPRKVTIYNIQLTDYSYSEVKFTAKVSSGTYIRSLVEDIGKELGTGAYMSGLCRTEVGVFSIKNANPVQGVDITRHVFDI